MLAVKVGAAGLKVAAPAPRSQSLVQEALERVLQAADRVSRLEPRLVKERAELPAAILEAHAQGASVQLIARAASLARQRVQQIIAAAK